MNRHHFILTNIAFLATGPSAQRGCFAAASCRVAGNPCANKTARAGEPQGDVLRRRAFRGQRATHIAPIAERAMDRAGKLDRSWRRGSSLSGQAQCAEKLAVYVSRHGVRPAYRDRSYVPAACRAADGDRIDRRHCRRGEAIAIVSSWAGQQSLSGVNAASHGKLAPVLRLADASGESLRQRIFVWRSKAAASGGTRRLTNEHTAVRS